MLANRLDMVLGNVISPNFGFTGSRQMRGKKTTHGATADNANPDQASASSIRSVIAGTRNPQEAPASPAPGKIIYSELIVDC